MLLPYPSQGHINPLLQFAKRLASKGVKATLATTHYTAKSMCGPHVGVEPISDGFDEGGYAQAKNEDLFLKSFKDNGSRTLSELIKKYKTPAFLLTVLCTIRFCHGLLMWPRNMACTEPRFSLIQPLCATYFVACIMDGLHCP